MDSTRIGLSVITIAIVTGLVWYALTPAADDEADKKAVDAGKANVLDASTEAASTSTSQNIPDGELLTENYDGLQTASTSLQLDGDEPTDADEPEGPSPYTWTQDNAEVVFELPLPANCSSKNIEIVFRIKWLSIKVKGREVMCGETFKSIQPDECSWQLEGTGDKRTLVVTLLKKNLGRESYRWSSLLEGHPTMFESVDRSLPRPGQ